MQYIKGLESYAADEPCAVSFGKFDGLHRGHRALVDKVKELAEKENMKSVVCAFDMKRKGMLTTGEERRLYLEGKADCLVSCPFTKEFRELSAEAFIRDVIKGVFRADYVVIGTDFCFGHEKRGDVHMLAAYAGQYDYELVVIEKKRYEGKIISSTYIKETLQSGNISDASQMLGYDFGVRGIVEHGKRLGRTLGFPTMNVPWPEEKIAPPRGVYLCRAHVGGKAYGGIANIGVKPTVSEEGALGIESFLFGYEGDAYEKDVHIELLAYMRPERRFQDKEELKKYVDRDIANAREYFKIKG